MTGAQLRSARELIERATAGADHHGDTGFGPVPLRISTESPDEWNSLAQRLFDGAPRWPELHVVSVTAATIPITDFPTEFRLPGNRVVATDLGEIQIIASGLEQSIWMLDRRHATAMRWGQDSGNMNPWERASPLRSAACWWSAESGGAFAHTAAISSDSGALLLVGQSGAGKSTTSLSCLGSELDVLGDDFCFIEPPTAHRGALVHAAYRLAKLDDRALALMPHLARRAAGEGPRGKTLIELDHVERPHQTIAAVCHIVQDPSSPTHVRPISRIEALRSVAPSTVLHVRPLDERTWGALTAVVRSVPCFQLSVNDLQSVPTVAAELLETLGDSASSRPPAAAAGAST